MKRTLGERFLDKVNKTETCWLWTASRFTDGYGKFGINRRNRRGHRVSWELFVGQIPEGMQVLHKCDVRTCVRPDHLFLGTHQDNMDDRDDKGRSAHGERIRNAKLSDLQVREILNIRDESAEVVGLRFGVSGSTVCRIWLRRTWAHLPDNGRRPRAVYKLTEEQARAILDCKGTDTARNVAARFGVAGRTVGSIWERKRWKDL